jgi:hypothetical protein
MKKLFTLSILTCAALMLSACPGGAPANNANNANKPTNAANNAANSGNANKSNTTGNTNSANSSKKEIKDEKAQKPTGETKKQKNAPTIPAEWIYYSDEVRGYGFYLPAGSVEGESGTTDGVDYFTAETPEKISVIVYAFKDSKLTKDDLLDRAEKALNAMGETVKTGELKGESEDYAMSDATSESKDGTKSNLHVLVATDVTDNYVMFVRSAAADYEKNKATMNNIWGSFEMYSGGASGNN